MSADPYVVSSALRRRFREEKKIALEKQGRDDGLRERYGLHEGVDLGGDDVERGKAMWEAGRERAGLPLEAGTAGPSGTSDIESSTRAARGTPTSVRKGKGRLADTAVPDLASLLRKTTAKKYDPFSDDLDSFLTGSSGTPVRVKTRLKEATPKVKDPPPAPPSESNATPTAAGAMASLGGYGSD